MAENNGSDRAVKAVDFSKKKITGKELAAWPAHASMLTKLCVAAAWATGELDPHDLTVAQIARTLGVKSKQVRVIAEMTPEQRAALTNRRRLNGVGHMSNDVLDDLVAQVGANRMWAAIDRATMPKSKPAGNGSDTVAAE